MIVACISNPNVSFSKMLKLPPPPSSPKVSFETAKDIGDIHTDAFRILTEKYDSYKDEKRPLLSTTNDVIDHVAEVTASYCSSLAGGEDKKEQQNCESKSVESTNLVFSSPPYLVYDEEEFLSNLPENINPQIQDLMTQTFDVVSVMDIGNYKESSEILEDIQKQLEELSISEDDGEKLQRFAGLAGVGVALESASFWNDVMTDPDHSLNSVRDSYQLLAFTELQQEEEKDQDNEDMRRRLDSTMMTQMLGNLVVADSMGAVNSLMAVMSSANAEELMGNIPTLIMESLVVAIPSSMQAMMMGGFSGGGGFGGDDDYGY